MLTSQARRRLVQKTSSALGLVGTFVLLAGSLVVSAAPASAAALVVEKNFTYTCQGGPFSNTSITVKLSAPDSAAAGTTFNATVGIPALTLRQAVTTATTVSAAATLTVTNGTVTTPGAKTGADVAVNQTAVPAKNVEYPVQVTTAATGKVTIKPASLTLALASAATTVTTCTTTSTESLDVTIGTGGGGNTEEIVSYTCTAGTETPATVDIKITPTMPTGAKANQDASITWAAAVQTTGDELKVPTTGFPTGSKYFATVKASGAGAPATATGEAAITGTAGQSLTTLPNVTIKVRPTTTGTVTITPGDLAFGTSATAAALKCTAPTTGLPTFTFQVAAGTPTDDPTDDPTTTPTATPTKTTTVIVTETPTTRTTSPTARSSKTPKDGVATGAGGDAGPDGRMFVLAGSMLILAAGGGGLLMRRRAARG
ncbi:hypothetical protein [Nonomuraea sp. C10]|uniref:hypothetical protein n=1 Tax=Nonomuraea sp. C10 TaxID=2600577 RepID=UPI0011CD63F1|nr:hypothetical protein [Nonomuraea sp. C10]TXK35757.1 hypothetical protein FR742_42020 [Nonomuraea sp. C10]